MLQFRPNLILICFFIQLVSSKNYEILLYEDLLKEYDQLERPAENYADTVDVWLGLVFQQLVDVVNIILFLIQINGKFIRFIG